MTSSAFRLNTDFARLLTDRYTAAVATIRSAGLSEQITLYELSLEQIAEFIEVAFWASLTQEEEKYHDFRLELSPPPPKELQSFIYERSLPYQPEQLAKLAPAVKFSDCAIGVRVNDENRLAIWGFTQFPGMGLAIKTFGPGEILVPFPYGDQYFSCRITGSSADFIDSSKLNLPLTLFQKMATEALSSSNIHVFGTALFRSGDLERIARTMRSHGHGGTLLIVPEESDWRKSISQPFAYAGEPYARAKNDLKWAAETRDKQDRKQFLLISEEYRRGLDAAQRSLEAIAQLTAVDGATVVDYELAVLAFGVKINARDPEKKPEKVLMWEPFEGTLVREISLSHHYGTRHQSAAQFVLDQKDSIAIVASQDGRLSVLAWDNEKQIVTMIRHAEFALD